MNWTIAWLAALTIWGAWVRYKQWLNAKETAEGFEYWGGSQRDVSRALRGQISTLSGQLSTCDGAIVALQDTMSVEVKRLEERIDTVGVANKNGLAVSGR